MAESEAEVLSEVDESDSEVETLPDNGDDDINDQPVGNTSLQARQSSSRNERSRAAQDGSRTAIQAAKAIEAAEDLDRVNPPTRSPEIQRPDLRLPPTPTAEASERTPLLDAGPAQPPPDYAAATAWRRTMPSNGVAFPEATTLQASASINQNSSNDSATASSQPAPASHSSPHTANELESGRLKGYKRRRTAWRVLDRTLYLFFKLMYLISVLIFRAGRLFGAGAMAFVRRCMWLSFAIFLAAVIAGLVFVFLTKRDMLHGMFAR